MRVLGLMSGTSADGVDAVLASFEGSPRQPRWRLLSSAAVPYPVALRSRLIAAGQGTPLNAADVLELGEALTELQAEAARACDPEGRAELVGCHGQTLWHRPPHEQRRGCSWQLLQGPLLAELLQRPVVFDFRAADLALGGQGAPLVPAADAALLPAIGGWRALLNLGGIANLTLLPPATGPDRGAAVRGWDCGPANTLLDLAVEHFSGSSQRFDADGAWAAQGSVDEALIEQWLQLPYLQQQPPKSTGRELFGQADLQQRLSDLATAAHCRGGALSAADALATLTAFTAAVVAQDLARAPAAAELLVAGGGARNRTLMAQLRRRCRGLPLRPLAELGIGDSDREALAFALLAWWHHRGVPGSLPAVTGARRPAVLGVCAHPSSHSSRSATKIGHNRAAFIG
ncbi:MAG: anhydro-N-acetylmuramic acid kinase [Cyanobacteria bacterium M_surface_10_m2_179]|nr:anhydro-N-acetylmuramic acid kinase [Cyanobacteria bacterium M_surface_10_m2_179]